ncbi:hypothetical protein JCM5353_002254 [Sporobolomyces roseus]
MERQVVIQHHGAAIVQAGVHEGEYSPHVLAHMIELAVYEIQKILDPPRGPPHWSMLKDRYRCRPGNLLYLGFEASYQNAHVDKAHNVQLPAIPIPACFHPPSQQWVAYYSDTAQRVQENQAIRKGFMAGPRYHQYLQLDGKYESEEFKKVHHRLHLKQQNEYQSIREIGVPQVAIWQGHHWQRDEHNKEYLTIVKLRFTPIPAPQFQPLARSQADV